MPLETVSELLHIPSSQSVGESITCGMSMPPCESRGRTFRGTVTFDWYCTSFISEHSELVLLFAILSGRESSEETCNKEGNVS